MGVELKSKTRLDELKQDIEAATGETYTDLTEGIQALANGYGQLKDEQEKTIEITENGTTEVLPDDGKVLSKVTVNVEVESGGEDLAALETKIDESGLVEYMDPPPATLSEKIDRLIAYTELWKYTSVWQFQNQLELTEIPVYINKHLGPYALYGTTNLKRMVGVRSSTNMTLAFGNSGIEVIERPFDFSNITSASGFSPFLSAGKLVEVRIVEGTMSFGTTISSPYLSDDSIQSIVDGLADLTGKTQQKLTLHAAVTAKLTEAQIATITSKNWVVA